MRLLPFTFGVLALGQTACSPKPQTEAPSDAPVAKAETPPSTSISGLPAGDYKLDATHASLNFRVNHLGFTQYTAGFDRFDAQLTLDPANPAAAQLKATVDVKSLDLPAPPEGFIDDLLDTTWFDAGKFPDITFVSTKVEMTGANTARIHGDLTLRGVTKPIVLDAKFNGGYPGIPQMDPNARIGFSATGTLKRSDFGMSYGIPEAGSTMGVSDAVDIAIEAEFSGPELKS